MKEKIYTFERLKRALSDKPFTNEELEKIKQDLVDIANEESRTGGLSGKPFVEKEQKPKNKVWKSAVEQRLPPEDRGEKEE